MLEKSYTFFISHVKCFSLNHKVAFLPSPSGNRTVKITYIEFLNAKPLRGEKCVSDLLSSNKRKSICQRTLHSLISSKSKWNLWKAIIIALKQITSHLVILSDQCKWKKKGGVVKWLFHIMCVFLFGIQLCGIFYFWGSSVLSWPFKGNEIQGLIHFFSPPPCSSLLPRKLSIVSCWCA